VCVRACACVCVRACACVRVRACVCGRVCGRALVCSCVHACMRASMPRCGYTHIRAMHWCQQERTKRNLFPTNHCLCPMASMLPPALATCFSTAVCAGIRLSLCACVRACEGGRVRGCERSSVGAWVRGCVGACACVCVGARIRACVLRIDACKQACACKRAEQALPHTLTQATRANASAPLLIGALPRRRQTCPRR